MVCRAQHFALFLLLGLNPINISNQTQLPSSSHIPQTLLQGCLCWLTPPPTLISLAQGLGFSSLHNPAILFTLGLLGLLVWATSWSVASLLLSLPPSTPGLVQSAGHIPPGLFPVPTFSCCLQQESPPRCRSGHAPSFHFTFAFICSRSCSAMLREGKPVFSRSVTLCQHPFWTSDSSSFSQLVAVSGVCKALWSSPQVTTTSQVTHGGTDFSFSDLQLSFMFWIHYHLTSFQLKTIIYLFTLHPDPSPHPSSPPGPTLSAS